jgi:hypothetical protein
MVKNPARLWPLIFIAVAFSARPVPDSTWRYAVARSRYRHSLVAAQSFWAIPASLPNSLRVISKPAAKHASPLRYFRTGRMGLLDHVRGMCRQAEWARSIWMGGLSPFYGTLWGSKGGTNMLDVLSPKRLKEMRKSYKQARIHGYSDIDGC